MGQEEEKTGAPGDFKDGPAEIRRRERGVRWDDDPPAAAAPRTGAKMTRASRPRTSAVLPRAALLGSGGGWRIVVPGSAGKRRIA
jgi:hypothetical protein